MVESSTENPSGTILVIEDHRETRTFLDLALSDGYEVDCAADAESALEMTQKTAYDLLLVDIALQDTIDGVELVRRLRERPDYADTPVIAMTAHRKRYHRQTFLEQGFDEFLAKPFFPEDLLETIEGLLASKSTESRPRRR